MGLLNRVLERRMEQEVLCVIDQVRIGISIDGSIYSNKGLLSTSYSSIPVKICRRAEYVKPTA